MKSEGEEHAPNAFTISDLAACVEQTSSWEGVRNHQAKNQMLEMKKGDRCIFYHSSCKEPGCVGVVSLVLSLYIYNARSDERSISGSNAIRSEK